MEFFDQWIILLIAGGKCCVWQFSFAVRWIEYNLKTLHHCIIQLHLPLLWSGTWRPTTFDQTPHRLLVAAIGSCNLSKPSYQFFHNTWLRLFPFEDAFSRRTNTAAPRAYAYI